METNGLEMVLVPYHPYVDISLTRLSHASAAGFFSFGGEVAAYLKNSVTVPSVAFRRRVAVTTAFGRTVRTSRNSSTTDSGMMYRARLEGLVETSIAEMAPL